MKEGGGKDIATGGQSRKQLCREIIKTAQAMSHSGLSPGRSGNVSARWRDGMLITPSGMAYGDLKPRDIVFVDGDGRVPERRRKDAGKSTRKNTGKSAGKRIGKAEGRRAGKTERQRVPSSEWRFHLAAYGVRAEDQAIVHCHSMHATVLACAHKPIPAFHYMVAAAGGDDIPLVAYATFGTESLSKHVRQGLRNRRACLMANHGQIACGATLQGALELAHEVEELAEQYYKVLLLGEPNVLDAAEMARVRKKFESYGQKAQVQ